MTSVPCSIQVCCFDCLHPYRCVVLNVFIHHTGVLVLSVFMSDCLHNDKTIFCRLLVIMMTVVVAASVVVALYYQIQHNGTE